MGKSMLSLHSNNQPCIAYAFILLQKKKIAFSLRVHDARDSWI